MSSSQTSAKRFELPALDLNFGNITDGTNIPPPPDSPIRKEPTPPATPSTDWGEKSSVKALPTASNGSAHPIKAPANSNGNLAGTKRPADWSVPSSPLSVRQGSLRRLFSRNALSNSYAEGQLPSNGNGISPAAAAATAASVPRPSSQSGGSIMDERKSKRSSGWFRRLRTGDSIKKSNLVEEYQAPPSPAKTTGPPPPMIPELSEFEKDEGSLGNDLFKNIK
ncbi:hypothetical protein S40288_03151 [Stachybotrys chartarum IBT 40288]|nr:hypothetical protein S40288_03151 [Stachybotrys chartarum IBT 40288]